MVYNSGLASTAAALGQIGAVSIGNIWPGAKQITPDSYRSWQDKWVFDALAGLRYGESFCLYFGVPNSSPLYWFKDQNVSARWIRDNYLQNETKVY